MSSGVPPSPVRARTTVTSSGPAAKPRLPPKANQLIPVWLPRVAALASRADSGWYMATPRPDRQIASQVSR